jgi:hypothetical protein
MMIGARLVAPQGFRCLAKDTVYYFLSSDAQSNRVRLVEFVDRGKRLQSILITLQMFEFEDGLELGLIREIESTSNVPPWLEQVAGVSVATREELRVSTKESYETKVNRRFAAISDLVLRFREIVASDSPDALINSHAKAQKPQQNAARLRLWFYSYVVFGYSRWALMPPLHRIGGWNRDVDCYVTRLGRPSPKGSNWGYRSDPLMKEKIRAGYVACLDQHGTFHDLYNDILTKFFGCKSINSGDGCEYVHPLGEPFPTESQVRRVIERSFNSKQRSEGVRGVHKTRALTGDLGSFAERLTSVYQRVEFDGFNISEKLSGVLEGSVVDSFCVVRATCGLSGLVLGIGFAEGKENMDAYRMCLLSMATDKVKYCELFGLTITKAQWPSEGLAGGIVFDRGPGATYSAAPEIKWLSTFENTPVFSGQSKATVESSHPRDKQTKDQPTFFHSRLNFVQMAKWQILQVLSDNHSSDASRRMDEELILARVKPSPIGIWNYWNSRARNSAIRVPFADAARSFMEQHPGVIRKDAVYFYGRKYRSAALAATGVFDQVAKSATIPITVYTLTMCVRHIWVEVRGELYELDFVVSQRTLEGSIDISLRDLQEIDRLRRKGNAAHDAEIPAIKQFFKQMFKEQTGQDADIGKRMKGRPKKTASAKRDSADYDGFRGKAG